MIVIIRTEVLPEAYRWDPHSPVTGTNKFYVRVAESLARKGHQVRVEYDGPWLELNGVRYRPRNTLRPRFWTDLLLDCNFQGSDSDERSRNRFQWTSFYARSDTCVGEGYDRIFLVSSYVESTLKPDLECPSTVLELGCEMDTIERPARGSERICCYTSSPDRGGNFLDSIWPEVEAATGYRLEKSPYGEAFSDAEMQALYDRASYWVYPAIGTDSIVSALEAQARGCVPFVVPHMGLPETLRYGIKTDLHRFKADLIRTLRNGPENYASQMPLREAALRARPIPTWDDVSERVLSYVRLP